MCILLLRHRIKFSLCKFFFAWISKVTKILSQILFSQVTFCSKMLKLFFYCWWRLAFPQIPETFNCKLSLSHTLTHSRTLSHTLAHSRTLLHTLAHSCTLSHTLTHSHTLSHTLAIINVLILLSHVTDVSATWLFKCVRTQMSSKDLMLTRRHDWWNSSRVWTSDRRFCCRL